MDLILYHSLESTCAQKVRLVLSEKGLPWQERLLNLRKGEQFDPAYLRLNPKAVVPTLVHGEHVVRESTVINEYLDDAFPDPALKPPAPHARAAMRLLVKTIDDEVHPAVGFVTYAAVLRQQMNESKTEEDLEEHFRCIADPMRRERQRLAHDRGFEAPQAPAALASLARFVGQLDAALDRGGPWLVDGQYSLADAAALPYIVRLEALHLAPLWQRRPRVIAWIERARERENCASLQDPWGTPAFEAMLARHADAARPQVHALLARLETG